MALDALHCSEKLSILRQFSTHFVIFFCTSSLKDFENFSQLKQLIKNTSETFILLLPDFVIQFCFQIVGANQLKAIILNARDNDDCDLTQGYRIVLIFESAKIYQIQ